MGIESLEIESIGSGGGLPGISMSRFSNDTSFGLFDMKSLIIREIVFTRTRTLKSVASVRDIKENDVVERICLNTCFISEICPSHGFRATKVTKQSGSFSFFRFL